VGHQQIERELHRIALDRRHALGALTIVAQRGKFVMEAGDFRLGSLLLSKRYRLPGFWGCGHALSMPDSRPARIVLSADEAVRLMDQEVVWRMGDPAIGYLPDCGQPLQAPS
jgi:hypothetical protein